MNRLIFRNSDVPVTCKIRIFPKLEDTINYAKMLEDAGCQVIFIKNLK